MGTEGGDPLEGEGKVAEGGCFLSIYIYIYTYIYIAFYLADLSGFDGVIN